MGDKTGSVFATAKGVLDIEDILYRLGHDPRGAAAGWRSDDPLVVASLFALHGYPVFPCNKYKRPLTNHGFHDATSDLHTLYYWDRVMGIYGWCVRTGRYEFNGGPAGLWILDIDDTAGYAWLAELELKLGPLPPTWTNTSGRVGGGEHRMFSPASDGPDMKTVGKAMISGRRGKIDQKGRGGYAVTAGSYHASGKRYHWADGCAPDEVALAQLPAEWLAAIDKADVTGPPRTTVSRSRTPLEKKNHDSESLLIGDRAGFGGFQNPLYRNAIQYFLKAGVEAPAEPITEFLRELIIEAPKDPGRDVSRYLSGPDLLRIVERAQSFVKRVKEEEHVEHE